MVATSEFSSCARSRAILNKHLFTDALRLRSGLILLGDKGPTGFLEGVRVLFEIIDLSV